LTDKGTKWYNYRLQEVTAMAEKILVIGGGAAGLMAAITAARAGGKVMILEAGERVGKKLLTTGNGKCNFTNLHMEADCYHTEQPAFVERVLEQFNEKDAIAFFESLGISARVKNGYVYPRSEQAASVLDALRLELDRCHIPVAGEEKVQGMEQKGRQFQVRTSRSVYTGSRVILAAGGQAVPKTGSDGSGYALAAKLGHRIVPVIPALVQLRAKERIFKSIAGVRTQARVRILADGELLAEDTGELQLTEYGISGIPVFQVSRHAAKALMEKKQVKAILDFLPEMTEAETITYLEQRKQNHPNLQGEQFLQGLLPKKLAALCMKGTGGSLVQSLKQFTVEIEDTNGFANAQVCGGGVDMGQVSPVSCESKLVPGLYFAGEILDADGLCGGYNLQWAWSTGYLAGFHAAGRKVHP